VTNSSEAASSRATRTKIIVAVGVIVLCGLWLGYQLIPWRGGPPVVAPASAADRFLVEARKVHAEERFEHVILVGSDDGVSVEVSGKVGSEADLKELRSRLDELAGATPGVTMKFSVVVGRLK